MSLSFPFLFWPSQKYIIQTFFWTLFDQLVWLEPVKGSQKLPSRTSESAKQKINVDLWTSKLLITNYVQQTTKEIN